MREYKADEAEMVNELMKYDSDIAELDPNWDLVEVLVDKDHSILGELGEKIGQIWVIDAHDKGHIIQAYRFGSRYVIYENKFGFTETNDFQNGIELHWFNDRITLVENFSARVSISTRYLPEE